MERRRVPGRPLSPWSFAAPAAPAPPYHYEYAIRVEPAEKVQISYWPGFDTQKPLAWSEEAALTADDRDRLYDALRGAGVFGASWREHPNSPIGGYMTWLRVTAAARQYRIPSHQRIPGRRGRSPASAP